jgi:hypothetical protein
MVDRLANWCARKRSSVSWNCRNGRHSLPTYLNQIAKNQIAEREYFAWAQGFLSGLLMRAPPGRDESLKLNPAEFPVGVQLPFLREYCATQQKWDFTDAVIALFQKLREYSK